MRSILLILLLVIALRIPSLFEPYWYGDEGIYLTIGQAMRQGSQLYAQIHDNKPPLLYVVAALANGSQVWFRLIMLVWNLGSVIIFWKLAQAWFENDDLAKWASLFFVLATSLPMIEGNIANAELFFIGLTIPAMYLAYKSQKLFLAGLLFGIAALFKMPAIIEVGVFPLFWLVTRSPGWFKKSLLLGIGALLPVVASIIYYYTQGTLNNYLIAAGLQNIPYLSSWQAVEGIIGTLPGRAAILGTILLLIVLAKSKMTNNGLLLAIWFIAGTFSILLSGRPYPHYILQIAAPIALALAMLFQGAWRDKYPAAGALLLLGASLVTFHFYSYPSLTYYQNFAQFIIGTKTQSHYFNYFNTSVNRNYQIAKVIMHGSQRSDRVFIWGDEPMIYALARRVPLGRFTAKYHILDFRAQDETMTQLKKTPPKYIVVVSPVDQLAGLSEVISEKYILEKEVEGVEIYRLSEGILQAQNSIIKL